MAVTGVWKLAVIGLGPNGEAVVNTFHYGPDGTDPTLTAQSVADAGDATLAVKLRLLVTDDWTYLKTTALCIAGANVGKSAESAVSAPLVGNLASPSASMTVAAIGRRRADTIGRHSRGRCFLSPIPLTSVSVDGKFTPPGTFEADWGDLNASSLNAAGTVLVGVLWDQPNTQAVKILTGDVAKLSGVMRRRRLRLPN